MGMGSSFGARCSELVCKAATLTVDRQRDVQRQHCNEYDRQNGPAEGCAKHGAPHPKRFQPDYPAKTNTLITIHSSLRPPRRRCQGRDGNASPLTAFVEVSAPRGLETENFGPALQMMLGLFFGVCLSRTFLLDQSIAGFDGHSPAARAFGYLTR